MDRLEAARKTGVSPADRTAGEEEAQAHYRQAGVAYAKAADQTPAPADQAERLWMSVACYLDGHDAARAVPVLERFLKLDNPAERAGEAWYRLAEAQSALHNEAASEAAYKKATQFPGRGAAPARLQLAVGAIARGDYAVAEGFLEENVDHANKDVDEETARRSLFALGDVHLQRRSLQNAILRLEQAMHEYPKSIEMNQARYQLAECFRLQAEEAFQGSKAAKLPESREFYLKQHREYLEKAANKYQELADDLGARSRGQSLTKEEEEVYWIAAFNSAHGCYLLGQYEKACKLFEGLAARFHDRLESLDALAWVARCWLAKSDSAKGMEAVKRLETALRELDDAKFSKEPGAVDRKKWEAWVKEAYKTMGQP
jgi:tetratricopeptide (TPR) repeat protein